MKHTAKRITTEFDEKGYVYRGYTILRREETASGYWGAWIVENFHKGERYTTYYDDSLRSCKEAIDLKLN